MSQDLSIDPNIEAQNQVPILAAFPFLGAAESAITIMFSTHFLCKTLEGRHLKLSKCLPDTTEVPLYFTDLALSSGHPANGLSKVNQSSNQTCSIYYGLNVALLHEIIVSVQADLHQPSLILELTCTDGHKHKWIQKKLQEKNLSDVKINKYKYIDAASVWGSTYADQQALGACATERVIMYIVGFPLYALSPKHLLAK